MRSGIVATLTASLLATLLPRGAEGLSGTDSSSEAITSIEQADALVRATQEQFWQLFPPSDDWLYIHSEKSVRPVVWSSGWPDALKKQMYAEMRSVNGNLYPVYTVWAEADRITGDLTYYNGYGQPVWTSPAPLGYTPLSPVIDRFGVENVGELSESQQQFTASSIGLELQLIPDTFLASYEVDFILEQQAATLSSDFMMTTMLSPPPPDGTSTNGGTGTNEYQTSSIDYGDDLYLEQNLASYENGWMEIRNAEAGQSYEVYFTYNLQYIPFSTNPSSHYTAWPAKVGLVGQGDEVAYWSGPLVGENGLNRNAGFFKAYASTDSDGDGLSDIYELMMTKSDPFNPRSIDGVALDGDVDLDGDGFTNREEYLGLGVDVYTHPWLLDSDNDGVNDNIDPWPMDYAGKEDTDRDGMPDELNGISTSYPPLVEDLDDDNDGFTDVEEAMMGSDPKDADSPGSNAFLDSDGDGLYDWEEAKFGTNPNQADTDNDGIGDGYEKKVLATNPLVGNGFDSTQIDAYNAVAGDADGDGRPLWLEARDSTNPNDGLDFNVVIF